METQEFKYTDSYKAAQTYELACNNDFVEKNIDCINVFKKLFGDIKEFKKNGYITDISKGFSWQTIIEEFFKGSVSDFYEFIEKIKYKNNLEIGSGPCGLLNSLYWIEKRNIIEPLIKEYKQKQIELYGETLFDNSINLYSQPAEIIIQELINNIDGVIICRNCLDHTQDWKIIVENISKYAALGSYLLLWTDLFHIGTDAGHFNITKDKKYFIEYVQNLGYEIINEWEMSQRQGVNIGFIAIKI